MPLLPETPKRALPLLALLAACLLAPLAFAQLSKPITDEEKIDYSGHRFRSRAATRDREVKLNRTADEVEDAQFTTCHRDVAIKWSSEVSSSVYGTPLITDLYSDGIKDILVPSFLHYLDALEGSSGAPIPGFPSDHHEKVHASPLLYDIDGDGVSDIMLATFNGELLWFQEDGTQRYSYYSLIPRLRVRKDWHRGLSPDPDIRDPTIQAHLNQYGSPPPMAAGQGRRLLMASDAGVEQGTTQGVEEGSAAKLTSEGLKSFEVFKDPEGGEGAGAGGAEHAATWKDRDEQEGGTQVGGAAGVTDEDLDRTVDLGDQEAFAHGFEGGGDDGGGDYSGGDDDFVDNDFYDAHHGDELNGTDAEGHPHHHHQGNGSEWGEDYADWDDWHGGHEWGDYSIHEPVKGFIDIDAHVLATPVIADIDGDGQDELIAGVSFFFEREYYDRPEHRWEVAKDLDLSKYVAGAVVAWDIKNRAEKWRTHLDLSTDLTEYRAYIYSSPVVADIDGDGHLEVIIGTSAGFVYVLDHKGKSVEGWPVEMGEVQATPLVADLNGDGYLEVLAADMKGNVAVYDRRGRLLWERHLGAAVSAAPFAADMDGDGFLEVTMGTHAGEVYVMRGRDGKDVAPFPFTTRGRVMATPLMVDLAEGGIKRGGNRRMDVVVPSFDGYLYVIDGDSGCAEAVDIGENSYSMVLADDLDADGTLDLVVATMNGNVFMLETKARYHPLRAWTGSPPGNLMVSPDRHYGIHVAWDSRVPRDVRGENFPVRFNIIDRRPDKARNVTASMSGGQGQYRVLVALEGVGVAEMRAGDQPIIGMADNYRTAGSHTLLIPAPRTRSTATVTVKLTDPHGRVFRDSFALSFHVNFYRMLKWVMVGPFLLFAAWGAVIASRQEGGDGLPMLQPLAAGHRD